VRFVLALWADLLPVPSLQRAKADAQNLCGDVPVDIVWVAAPRFFPHR
jgi:hypothetical protein